MNNLQNVTNRKNRPIFNWFAIVSLLVFILSQSASADEPPAMWGNLTPGPYKVGFRSVFEYDLARHSVPYSDWDGRLYPTDQQPGRQMQINIWYPAEITAASRSLTFGHYVDLMARQTDFSPIDENKRRFANEQFISKTNSLGGNGSFTEEKLELLRNMATGAYDNPEPIAQKFPLIVFPNGASPAFQSIMSEFFASHGFIVAAGALKGQFGMTEDVSVRGFETAVDDLGFLVNRVLELEQADAERVCLMGNAITASQVVAYQSRNDRIDCVVSLDGGFLSRFDQRILQRTAFYEPQDVNKPLMAIYASHPSIDPENIAHLRYSRRFLFHFPQMSEFHFLNYGAFEKFVPQIIGEPKGDVQTGFELAAKYCLEFFEAFLKDNQESKNFLSEKPTAAISDQIDKAEVLAALTPPPNTTTVKNAFLEHGIEYIKSVYASLKEESPTPFSQSFYNDINDWLAYKKDPEYKNRFELYQLALDSYPDSAMINFHLAYFALMTGRKDMSRTLNERSLELLETDTSAELTPELKTRMRELIRKDLESLD